MCSNGVQPYLSHELYPYTYPRDDVDLEFEELPIEIDITLTFSSLRYRLQSDDDKWDSGAPEPR